MHKYKPYARWRRIDGAPSAIVHLCNSVSTLQRRVVFGLDKPGIVGIATRATAPIKAHAERLAPRTRLQLEYSPETFTGTELDVAMEICEAVVNEWNPTAHNLTGVESKGLGKHLFAGMTGGPDLLAKYEGATVVVARENFACGSSREHAAWAPADRGFSAVVAPSADRRRCE